MDERGAALEKDCDDQCRICEHLDLRVKSNTGVNNLQAVASVLNCFN